MYIFTGVGKSSLMRAIAGLWSKGQGTVSRPAASDTLFLSQKPYITLGSFSTPSQRFLQLTATHCNALQCTATHCNILQPKPYLSALPPSPPPFQCTCLPIYPPCCLTTCMHTCIYTCTLRMCVCRACRMYTHAWTGHYAKTFCIQTHSKT